MVVMTLLAVIPRRRGGVALDARLLRERQELARKQIRLPVAFDVGRRFKTPLSVLHRFRVRGYRVACGAIG